MSAKMGNQRNKEKCQAYKNAGRKAINKELKAKRHEKRMAKFAKRREDGKTYEYKPNPFKEGTKKWREENQRRAEKNVDRRIPIQINDSVNSKLKTYLAQQKEMEKRDAKTSKASGSGN